MKKLLLSLFIFLLSLNSTSLAGNIKVAPRISDKEIIERLTRLEEGQKALNKRIDDLREEMNSRFVAMDKRLDTLQWMLGLFISVALIILGFVLKMQWQMQKRQTQIETEVSTLKDEISFLKTLIERLLPPKGVLKMTGIIYSTKSKNEEVKN